jgi:hypothetical protein
MNATMLRYFRRFFVASCKDDIDVSEVEEAGMALWDLSSDDSVARSVFTLELASEQSPSSPPLTVIDALHEILEYSCNHVHFQACHRDWWRSIVLHGHARRLA